MASIHLFPTPKPPRKLNEFPIVSAPCPDDPNRTVSLEFASGTVQRLVEARRRTDIFMGWAHLVGEMPPVNNAELVRRTEYANAVITSLMDASACFKGVRRRYDQEDDGRSVYVYSIHSPYTVRWEPSLRCVSAIVPSPAGTVLTVQVRPSTALQCESAGVWGAITKWEIVNADREHIGRPDGFSDRYDTLLWHR